MSWIYLTHACADFNDATHAASRPTDWGAPSTPMADGAGIDARCAAHDDVAALAICTDADADAEAARCPATQARIDASIAWRTQSRPSASICMTTQDRRVVREDGLCLFDTLLPNARSVGLCAGSPFESCWNRIQGWVNITET
ncbi:hypothetical protein [Xanthomonas sp. D-99]|uniref:hypothetical protein n=1 Tax=Xanthomonas sp. D-99 TaxID=2821273 RepID=UPI001FCFF861|nr:hypothetical protein [Xanthomonas sp. D-99]